MNKALLLQQIITELENVHQVACAAAKRAHDSATDKANKAENQYDTLGLEAAYLAHGQSQRVLECAEELAAFKQLASVAVIDSTAIRLGSLIQLVDEDDNQRWLFLGPSAGGLKLMFAQQEITLITPSAPLGEALIGLTIDDEIAMTVTGKPVGYEITAIY